MGKKISHNMDKIQCIQDTTEEGTSYMQPSHHKVTGPDPISARLLHDLAKELALYFTVIYKKFLDRGTVPKYLWNANVIATFKKSDRV